MALSNAFKEPRREITETLVGAAAVVGPLAVFAGLSYLIALWIAPPDKPFLLSVILTGILIMLVVFIVSGTLFVAHEIGEDVCNALQKRGIHLRPRQRPGRPVLPSVQVDPQVAEKFDELTLAQHVERVKRYKEMYGWPGRP